MLGSRNIFLKMHYSPYVCSSFSVASSHQVIEPRGITFIHQAQWYHKEFVSVNLHSHAATRFHKTGLTEYTSLKKLTRGENTLKLRQ